MSAVAVTNDSAPLKAIISPLAVAFGVPLWWAPLFQSCYNGSVFSSSAWMQSWLEVYGDDFKGTWVRWEHDGLVVGGCLLASRMTWKWLLPMRLLFVNATGETNRRTPLAEYNDILCLAGYEELIAADVARVVQTLPWSRLHALGYREGAVLSRVVTLLPTATVESIARKANFVDLTTIGGKEFEASLLGKAGNQIRRNRRLFEEVYGKFEVVRAQNLDEAMRFLESLADLHNARWRNKGQGGSFSSNAVVDFHQRLIARLWPLGAVDLLSVRTHEKIIGYLYNFTTEKKVYFFQSGFAYEDGSKRSPGLLTHALCIEHYRLKGYSEYDLLAGEAQYKRALAQNERSLFWTVVYRDTRWTRALLWARRVKSVLAKTDTTVSPSASK